MDTPSGNGLASETLTGAPPPPQEVKVRTMATDLASVAASGGGLPQYQNVKIAGIVAPQDAQGAVRKTSLVVAVVCIAAVLLVLIGGYFAYQSLREKTATQLPATGGQ